MRTSRTGDVEVRPNKAKPEKKGDEWWRTPDPVASQSVAKAKDRPRRPTPIESQAAAVPAWQPMLPIAMREPEQAAPPWQPTIIPRSARRELQGPHTERPLAPTPVGMGGAVSDAPVPATLRLTGARIKNAWQEALSPSQPQASLAEVFARGETEARPRTGPVSFAEMMAPPAMLAVQGQEAGPEAIGQGAQRVGEIAQAAWEQAKAAPVVGPVAKTAGAIVGTGLELLQVPQRAVEEGIGYLRQQTPGGYGLMSLSPGKSLTPEQEEVAQRVADETDVPLFVARQGVLAAERKDQPSLRDYALQKYGQSPQLDLALSDLAVVAGYSSYEQQRAALDGLMAGEDPNTIMEGREVDTTNPIPEDVAAFNAYITGVQAGGGDVEAARQQVAETGFIPARIDPWNELLFQFGLDPLNALDLVNLGSKAKQAQAAAEGRMLSSAAEAVPKLPDDIDDALDAMRAAEDVLPDVAADAVETISDLARSTDEVADPTGRVSRIRAWWDRVNPLNPTERAVAEQAANAAYQVAAPIIDDIKAPDQAVATLRALADDPQSLVPRYGRTPVGPAAEQARPLFQAVAADLEDVDLFPSLYDDRFSRRRFLGDLDRVMTAEAANLYVSPQAGNAYRKFARKFNSVMSEFYLRTPGYALRNAQGDLVTMAWDGTLKLGSKDDITDYLTRIGYPTRRVRGVAAGSQELVEEGSHLPGVLGKVSSKAGEIIGAQEEGRYARAFYAGHRTAWDSIWHPVIPDQIRGLMEPDQIKAIESALAKAVNADEMMGIAWNADVPPATRRLLGDWLRSDQFTAQLTDARAVASEWARGAADFSLLNYVAGEKKVDQWLRLAFPYTYWQTRSALNWLKRFAEKPAFLTAYAHYKAVAEAENRAANRPGKLAGSVEIPITPMTEWLGGSVFVNPTASVPFDQLFFRKTYDSQAKTAIDKAYQAVTDLGLRPYGFIDWPLTLLGIVGTPDEFGRILPHTGAVQALSVLFDIGGPTGIDLEGFFRRALPGVQEQEPYQAYRTDTMLAAMAAERPGLSQPILIAQQLNLWVSDGKITLSEAFYGSNDVSKLAYEAGWSRDQLEQGRELLREGAHRAAIQRAIQVLGSFGLGTSVNTLPTGERTQRDLAREGRGAGHSPLTGTGSREELERFWNEHPERDPWNARYGTLPGQEDETRRTPGDRWRSNEYRQVSQAIYDRAEAQVDDIKRTAPWDNDTIRKIYNQRDEDLQALRDRLGMTGEDDEWLGTEAGRLPSYHLSSVYGAAPEEIAAIRRDDTLKAIQRSLPDATDFEDDQGVIDWDGYYGALDTFWARLTESMRESKAIQAIAADLAERTGQPVAPDAILADISREGYEEYDRRNDSPVDAAVRMWKEKVYQAAWAKYAKAREAGQSGSEAYDKYIESIQGMSALEMIPTILEEYPGRWTNHELAEALGDMELPSVEKMNLMQKPVEEREQSEASSAFWDFYNEQMPPGYMSKAARENPMVAAITGAKDKSKIPADEYRAALAWLQEWRDRNEEPYWGGPDDWAEARRLNAEFESSAAEVLPGIAEILNGYYATPPNSDERRAYKREHPEVQKYFDMRDEFGTQPENEVWAYYYLGGQKSQSSLGTWYNQSGGKRYYLRSYGGGGGYSGGSNRELEYLASRVPRIYLDTPSPWQGALRFSPFTYRSPFNYAWQRKPKTRRYR